MRRFLSVWAAYAVIFGAAVIVIGGLVIGVDALTKWLPAPWEEVVSLSLLVFLFAAVAAYPTWRDGKR
jgi:TRAP-type C4-dicarboxylate transport system permease small subunit